MKDLKIYVPRIESMVIDRGEYSDVYSVVPVLSFVSDKECLLADELKTVDMAYRWKGDFLEGIDGLDAVVARLFGTDKIGLVYFVNKREYDIPIDAMRLKDEFIQLVYIEENWKKNS